MTKYLLISDAAKEVKVESHVLRYWEEELHLPIKRNELGHRYYTAEDVERFKEIKNMKERGLQLKAIKMILRDGQLDILPQEEADQKQKRDSEPIRAEESKNPVDLAIDIIHSRELEERKIQSAAPLPEKIQSAPPAPEKRVDKPESREEKARRLQWILQQLIRETLRENNQELCREMKESIVKELDYQFRVQEEREEEREQKKVQRNEEYYQRMDELLRNKARRFARRQGKLQNSNGGEENAGKEAKGKDSIRPEKSLQQEPQKTEACEAAAKKQKNKKRRHSIF